MGRKQISQLTYFDYVVGITIGSIASSTAIDKNITMGEGIFSITIWSILTILISEITLRNIKLRLLIDSEPLLIIDKGKVIYKNMKKARYNMGDLLMQLRVKDIFYITDVEVAILEPDGKLSVLKKAEKSLVTVEDVNITKPKTGMMVEFILDGKILHPHLLQINKNEEWVLEQLKLRNIYDINNVIFAGMQADEQIYIVTKNY
jgi:Predicted membrane protein